MATGTDNDYITPHRQFASYEPEDDAKPPPIARKPNMECVGNVNERRWADYADDEPLPEVIFGKKMNPSVVENLNDKFNSVDSKNWRREDEEWTVVNRNKPRKNMRWTKKTSN
mgnify:FL=1